MLRTVPYFKKQPLFLILLPIYFVLHGYIANYDYIEASAAIFLCLKYVAISILSLIIIYLLYKNYEKASIITFLMLSYYFFFGSFYDFIRNTFPDTLITRYFFIIPFSTVLFLILIIRLKKSSKNFKVFIPYLNTVFLILILINSATLIYTVSKKKESIITKLPEELTDCDTCIKPDIYLIVADEYANSNQLKEVFNFDNTAFEKDLQFRGFKVIQNSTSNYNETPYSISSMLDMKFIDLPDNKYNNKNTNTCLSRINNSVITSWLQKQEYEIKNHSIFRLGGQPNPIASDFFLTGTQYITAHTLAGRINRDIRWNFITKFKIQSEIKKFVQNRLNSINNIISKTIKESEPAQKINKPRFVYLHSMMPHYPYLTNSNGVPNYKTSFLESDITSKTNYLQYLLYSNKIYLHLIDKIQANSPSSIILFMGDHGFRHLQGSKNNFFMSFNSIYLPSKNYSHFYDGMSMVNVFRALLNSEFKQELPLLKDSSILLQTDEYNK